MVPSVSSPQSKAEEMGSTLGTVIGYYLVTSALSLWLQHPLGDGFLDIGVQLYLTLDYFQYAAYGMKKKKGGNTNSPWSKTEFLPIFRHRRHTTQFWARGGGWAHNYL